MASKICGFLSEKLISLWIERIAEQNYFTVLSTIDEWEEVYQAWTADTKSDFIDWLKEKGYAIPLSKDIQNNMDDKAAVIDSHSFMSQNSITLDASDSYLAQLCKQNGQNPKEFSSEQDDDTVSWSEISDVQEPFRTNSREDLTKDDDEEEEQEAVAIIPEPDITTKWKRKPRFLVIGNSGVGKSSFIRAMLHDTSPKKEEIAIGSGLKGVTMNVSVFESEDAILLDSCGLDEPKDKSPMNSAQALFKILKFMKNSQDGLDLLLFVHRGRISESFARNYEFFYKIIGKEMIPAILILTGGENTSHFHPATTYEERTKMNAVTCAELKTFNYNFEHVVHCCFAESCGNTFFKEIYASFGKISKNQVYLCLKSYTFDEPVFLWCEMNKWNTLLKLWNAFCEALGLIPTFSAWYRPLQKAKELFKLDEESFAALVSLFKSATKTCE